MCVYIFGRFTFKILGQTLLHWFIVCFFTLKHGYLLLSLFISITIISIIISIVTVTIPKYIVITFQFFATFTTYIWFPFCLSFLFVCLFVFLFSKLYAIIFCGFFKLCFAPFFFPHSFSVVTVNCDNRGRIQINEFERHSLPLPFNSDWSAVFGKYIFVLFPPN